MVVAQLAQQVEYIVGHHVLSVANLAHDERPVFFCRFLKRCELRSLVRQLVMVRHAAK